MIRIILWTLFLISNIGVAESRKIGGVFNFHGIDSGKYWQEIVPISKTDHPTEGLVEDSIAIIMVDLSDMKVTQEQSREKVIRHFKQVNQQFDDTTHGQKVFDLDLNKDGEFDIYTISFEESGSECSWGRWTTEGREQLRDAGIPIDRYKIHYFLYPAKTACNFGGMAQTDCAQGNCLTIVRRFEIPVTVHELGHNLGMHHAALDQNDDGVLESNYGDSSCPMGYRFLRQQFNAPHMIQMGWLQSEQILKIDGPGRYRIASLHYSYGMQPFQQVVRFSRDEVHDYFLSYRTAQGPDQYIDEKNITGVSIHYFAGATTKTALIKVLSDEESISLHSGAIVRQVFHDEKSVIVDIDW